MTADVPFTQDAPLTRFADDDQDQAAPAEAVGHSKVRLKRRVKVWDAPLRLFHWALLAAVATAITTGEIGGNWMTLHGQAGLVVLGLLVFRLLWGVVGSRTARFAQFAPTPARLKAYLTGRWQGVGHNPLGALSVFGLLGLLAVQVGTGLVANDEIAFTGPLNALVEESVGLRLTGWHKQLAIGLFGLLGLHVLAMAVHRFWKHHDLVRSMITGWAVAADDVDDASHAQRPEGPQGATAWASAGSGLWLFVSVAAALATVWWVTGPLALAAVGSDAVPGSTDDHTATSAVQGLPAAAPAASAVPAW